MLTPLFYERLCQSLKANEDWVTDFHEVDAIIVSTHSHTLAFHRRLSSPHPSRSLHRQITPPPDKSLQTKRWSRPPSLLKHLVELTRQLACSPPLTGIPSFFALFTSTGRSPTTMQKPLIGSFYQRSSSDFFSPYSSSVSSVR